ncbi:VOC family protein [Altererythrobacter sp.]|uniref:VOC family protein n=1 Tax=Altererythrobacter sp. TaxID=1872480 RepID=UPI003CFC42B1
MTVTEETDRAKLLEQTGTSPEKLAHIVLRTPEFEKMRDFYLTFLNARVAYQNDFVSFLRYDDEHHRIVIIRMPDLAPVQHRAAGLEHYAFTYPTMGALLANYVRLKAIDIHPCWCINHGFTTSIYYRDPDGNMVETQFDNMDVAQADAFMTGDYFDKNPIGVDFDPELLLARYRNGDPLAELVKLKAAPYAAGVPHIRPEGVPPYDADGELL